MRNISLVSVALFFAFFSSSKAYSQGPPPRIAIPADSNTRLVKRIIEVTEHEAYFNVYCTKRVKEYSKSHKWSDNKTQTILNSIDFMAYEATIYNAFAFLTTKQLLSLLTVLTDLKTIQGNDNMFILTNEVMQHNLDLYVEYLIKGHYVRKKD